MWFEYPGSKTIQLHTMDNQPLILDLVEWIAEQPRTYEEVMDAWRTSCPRLTIWEDTVDAGYVRVRSGRNSGRIIEVTKQGQALLDENGRVVRTASLKSKSN